MKKVIRIYRILFKPKISLAVVFFCFCNALVADDTVSSKKKSAPKSEQKTIINSSDSQNPSEKRSPPSTREVSPDASLSFPADI